MNRNQDTKSLYSQCSVKRGPRNADGTGILVELTEIVDVHGYILDEGERVSVDGLFITENIFGIGMYSLGLLEGIANLYPPYKISVLIDKLTYIPHNINNVGCFELINFERHVKNIGESTVVCEE